MHAPRYLKHAVHVVLMCSLVIYAQYEAFRQISDISSQSKPTDQSGSVLSYFLFSLQLLVFLLIPQMICNFLGLLLFDAFPGKVDRKPISSNNGLSPNGIKSSPDIGTNNEILANCETSMTQISLDDKPPSDLPHLCFRVVTRGLFPELVRQNVCNNKLTCKEAGLTNFSFEVVTDIDINITEEDGRVKQIVVPTCYESSTRTRFKARALQYALEPGVSNVQDEDYIVHLDEETILTNNVINGIINFALDGRHSFGQGLITYSNLEIVNIFTTLADSFRVSDDLGRIRFTLGALHRPIFGWKGSFVVTKCAAEKDVSFDHGEDGSVAEDCYFAMVAYDKGYTFDYIAGEMFEKSPFTLLDLIKQRKRWLQGIWLVVHSPKIPLRTKLFLAISLYSWITLPITSLNIIGTLIIVNLPYSYYVGPFASFCASLTIYMYLFGLVKSFDLKNQWSFGLLLLYLTLQLFTMSLYLFVENTVVIWGIFSDKHQFFIVKKDKSDDALANGRISLMAKL